MVIQEPVQAAIWQALNHYAYSDAIFLAERLYAEVGSDEALFLMATCYFRSGKPVQAYSVLQAKGCPTPQCKFLFAQCCLEINKLAEAETVLAGNILQKAKQPEDIVNEYGDAASFALRLLGKIYSRTERSQKAAESYRRSLKLNPFLWSSFESLCQLGEKPDPAKVFQVSALQNLSSVCRSTYPVPHYTTTPAQAPPADISLTHTSTPQVTPLPVNTSSIQQQSSFNSPTVENTEPMDSSNTVSDMSLLSVNASKGTIRIKANRHRSLLGGPASLSPLTPSFGVLPLEATPSPGISENVSQYITPTEYTQEGGKNPPAPRKRPAQRITRQVTVGSPPKPPVFSQSGNTNTTREAQMPLPQPVSQNVPVVRRSSRLFSNASSSVKENNKNQGKGKYTNPRAPVKKSKSRLGKSQQELNELNKSNTDTKPIATTPAPPILMATLQKQSVDGLMTLLQDIGHAHLALAQYNCRRAVQLFTALPQQHVNTGWVLCKIGKAYCELGDHYKAERYFAEAHQIEAHYIDGMETYSTVLWHIQKEVALSALAQELVEIDKDSPETWCAAGNCFSLQKEHDTAIKFFRRAIQVDPRFAYAYSLLGHEYVTTEELGKAMACFRNAVRVDPRHYTAWYGIGVIFFKQEKFALAEVHFKKALSIHPENSVLLCNVAVVQHALQKTEQALTTLNRAIALDPKNSLCKFHRASIWLACDKRQEALNELEELKQIVPKESLIYFYIGKVHKKLGNTHLALCNFSWAMYLDPKGANNQIKEAIDKRYVTEEDDPVTDPVGELDTTGADNIQEGLQGNGLHSNESSLREEVDNIWQQLEAMESDESL